jgi:hypothetical protein
MPNRVTKLVREIQNSGDEARKRRWLVGLSAFTMLIVVVLWLGYLNLTLVNVPGGDTAAAQVQTKEQNRGFVSAMQRGSAIVYHQIVGFLKEQSRATNNFEIRPNTGYHALDLPAITPREIK